MFYKKLVKYILFGYNLDVIKGFNNWNEAQTFIKKLSLNSENNKQLNIFYKNNMYHYNFVWNDTISDLGPLNEVLNEISFSETGYKFKFKKKCNAEKITNNLIIIDSNEEYQTIYFENKNQNKLSAIYGAGINVKLDGIKLDILYKLNKSNTNLLNDLDSLTDYNLDVIKDNFIELKLSENEDFEFDLNFSNDTNIFETSVPATSDDEEFEKLSHGYEFSISAANKKTTENEHSKKIIEYKQNHGNLVSKEDRAFANFSRFSQNKRVKKIVR